jgi:hypothetical protein
MIIDYRAKLQHLVEKIEYTWGDIPEDVLELIDSIRTALSQPEPEGVTTAELDALWLATWSDETQQYDVAAFARAAIAADRARLAHFARPTIRPKGTCQPNGYAYRYPAIDGTITRFNHGQEVNGCRPLYAIPYWLGQPPTAHPTIEPVSEALTDEAIKELTWRHTCEIGDLGVGIAVEDAPAFIRAALARYARPTTEPVPVAERLPGPEDCDEDGFCWFWNLQWERWRAGWQDDECTHWLPHHALPLPTPTP